MLEQQVGFASPSEVAARLRVSRSLIYNLTISGAIPALRVGRRRFRYDMDAVLNALRADSRPANVEAR